MIARTPADITLLLVDDEPLALEELAYAMRRHARRVVCANHGAEGLAAFETHHPDVVVTDIYMPVMDGLQMARALRASHPDLPIIATTAHSDPAHLVEALDAGVDHYVLKPVDLGRLATLVRRSSELVQQRRRAEGLEEERQRLQAEVRALQQALPVCSHCRRWREDAAARGAVQACVDSHPGIALGPGRCADCEKSGAG